MHNNIEYLLFNFEYFYLIFSFHIFDMVLKEGIIQRALNCFTKFLILNDMRIDLCRRMRH